MAVGIVIGAAGMLLWIAAGVAFGVFLPRWIMEQKAPPQRRPARLARVPKVAQVEEIEDEAGDEQSILEKEWAQAENVGALTTYRGEDE